MYFFDLSGDERVTVVVAELVQGGFAEQRGDFEELRRQVFSGFDQGREVAHEEVPDGDRELAGDGGDGLVAVLFEQQFPAPFVQRRAALVEGVLRALDQESTHSAR